MWSIKITCIFHARICSTTWMECDKKRLFNMRIAAHAFRQNDFGYIVGTAFRRGDL